MAEEAVTTTIVNSTSGAQLQIGSDGENTSDLINQVANEGAEEGAQAQQQAAQQQQTQADGGDVQQQVQQTQEALNKAEADLTQKGIDFAALEQEYQQNGALSQKSYDTLMQAGYPKEVVDATLAGWEANTRAFVNGVITAAGGEEQFARMQQFIKAQGGALVDTYNKAINSGDLGQIKMVIENVQNRMTKAYGSGGGAFLPSAGGGTPAPTGFENVNEMTKAINDPRYQVDSKYTKEVIRKIKYATFF